MVLNFTSNELIRPIMCLQLFKMCSCPTIKEYYPFFWWNPWCLCIFTCLETCTTKHCRSTWKTLISALELVQQALHWGPSEASCFANHFALFFSNLPCYRLLLQLKKNTQLSSSKLEYGRIYNGNTWWTFSTQLHQSLLSNFMTS